ncbi:glycosyltransferase [Lentilactobacillus buchneri]|uniref:glycosyltransferase n=1 Tax=Lentilactobacillus buchneri TaxID=1581 RepID=UPI0021A6C784|nr:glycosyltransferase [Lentilactobacillus buchneri]MCT3551747.1 glycosyltransferase [Lentilactobacillus buchneri]
MRILHYSLGFPPLRTGGLVKYSVDLAKKQAQNNNQVFFLYPGNIKIFNKKIRIHYDKHHSDKNFHVYMLINSLPLPLFGGIRTPKDFMVACDEKVYLSFLNLIKPDVIHIHTLMGIHKEFFLAAKRLNIKIFFTTHDYFGLAPVPNFFFNGSDYSDNDSIYKWEEISTTALSTWKLRIFQTNLYPLIRGIVTKFNKKRAHLNIVHNEYLSSFSFPNLLDDFYKLRKYYFTMFKMVDCFHFNSSIAKEVYTKKLYINDQNSCTISITNSDIRNHNIHKNYSKRSHNSKLRIGYIGPYKVFKGFYEFLKLEDIIQGNVEFHIFGSNEKIHLSDKFINHGEFNRNSLQNVYKSIDVLIVPSLWKETFGFIVPEAISFGVSVFVSSNVGAKDLIDDYFIFNNVHELKKKIVNYYKFKSQNLKSMEQHVLEIQAMYKNR